MRIWHPAPYIASRTAIDCIRSLSQDQCSRQICLVPAFDRAGQQHRPAEGLEGQRHRGRPQGPEQAYRPHLQGRFRCTTSATRRASSSCTRCDCSRAPRPIASSGNGKRPPRGGGAMFRMGFLDQTKVKSDAVRPRSATVTTPPRWANSCPLSSAVT